MIAGRDVIYVDFSNIPISNMPTSARQVGEMAAKEEKRCAEKAAADAAERKRQKKVDDAQLQVAADLQKMREKYEADLKSQAKENKFNRKLSIASFVVAVISLFISFFK